MPELYRYKLKLERREMNFESGTVAYYDAEDVEEALTDLKAFIESIKPHPESGEAYDHGAENALGRVEEFLDTRDALI